MDRQARLARIYETIRDIPEGSVASYGQIAEIAGIPRGARQVGWALRQLSDSQNVPWYRVITASGRIAFEKAEFLGQGSEKMTRDARSGIRI